MNDSTTITTKPVIMDAGVLIIDNDCENINELSLQLKIYNYSILSAKNFEEGLIKAEQHNPNLILLKIMMPNINGYEVYRYLKKQRKTRHIPIIFIKSPNDPEDENLDLPSAGTPFITKPFCQDKIHNLIESHLLLRALQVQLTEELLQNPTPEPKEIKLSIPPVGTNEQHDNKMYKLLVQNSPDAILVECEGEIVYANQAALSLYCAESVDTLIGRPLISLTAPESHMNAIIAFRELEHLNQVHTQEEKAQQLDEQTCDVCVTRLHFNYAGLPAVQMVVRDISKHKRLESQLHYQATHDNVTGLPNRSLFTDRVEQAINDAKQHQSELLVCFIDIDRFKRINDNMGHDIGDQLLVCLAERISSCIRSTDTVARMESDEFVLLLPFSKDKQNSLNTMENVLKKISKPITLNDQPIVVTCSIGYAHYPNDSSNGVDLLKFADTARYRAKENGRNTIQHYNASLQTLADEQAQLEVALGHALANQELSLQYQVQAELNRGSITGIEALLRWQHPKLGFISPARFIPIAEQAGLIEEITEWILTSVCQQSKLWQQQGCKTVPIAVNISVTSLRNPQRLENLVTRCLKKSQLDPTLLELEFTESASMDDPESIIPLMLRLKTLGVGLAIDDFGTGYSNLHYLKQLPIDKLKLDGSFVQGITTESRSLAIIDTIITLAKRLNLTVIAEMAETKEQIQVLHERGCDQVQGYYFSKPLVPQECAKLLDGRLMELPYLPREKNTPFSAV